MKTIIKPASIKIIDVNIRSIIPNRTATVIYILFLYIILLVVSYY